MRDAVFIFDDIEKIFFIEKLNLFLVYTKTHFVDDYNELYAIEKLTVYDVEKKVVLEKEINKKSIVTFVRAFKSSDEEFINLLKKYEKYDEKITFDCDFSKDINSFRFSCDVEKKIYYIRVYFKNLKNKEIKKRMFGVVV